MSKAFKIIGKCFGCHQKPERSFFFRGKQFPICARCTGNLLGIIAAIPVFILFGVWDYWLCIPLALPAFIDGMVQLKTKYESNNLKRFISGILLGFAYILVFLFQIEVITYIIHLIFK